MNLTKTQQFLTYIIKNRPRASITILMKLSYLIDLVSVHKNKNQITDFSYIRYYYGPYDTRINTELQTLIGEGIISFENAYVLADAEYTVYSFNKDFEDFEFNELSQEEKTIIDKIISDLGGYGAKTLTEIAYKTRPMKKLGATIGGTENLNEKVVLSQ
ncbi:MAG TPA: Panacea domain-containing protein [bacterium]|nr:Panacea domain-containing protein [bacterium]